MQYAGFWRRAFATLIDECVIIATALLAGGIVFGIVLVVPARGESAIGMSNWIIIAIGGVLTVCYYTYLEGRYGTTVGKHLLHTKLVRLDQPNRDGIGYGRALARLLIATVFQMLLLNQVWALMNVDSLWLLLDPRRRTLHDKALGTIVVHDPNGTFPAFDPETLKPRARRLSWFIILIVFAVACTVIQFTLGVSLTP